MNKFGYEGLGQRDSSFQQALSLRPFEQKRVFDYTCCMHLSFNVFGRELEDQFHQVNGDQASRALVRCARSALFGTSEIRVNAFVTKL